MAATVGFHVVTYTGTTILFWPQLACLTAFLPLERMRLSSLTRMRTDDKPVAHVGAADP
ncbi:MAG TPA: hypothetical protein VFF07_03125 [Actinomycetota bacterium]|nr:hypothetical protein [Actinomycetota bacterium]